MPEDDIEVTTCDLAELVRSVYRNSAPQGLGILHFREGELSDAEVQEILDRPSSGCRLSMDYVNGRSCKFHVFDRDGRLFIRSKWYDHSGGQLEQLLRDVGLSVPLCK